MIIVNDVEIRTIEDLLCVLEPDMIDLSFGKYNEEGDEIHAAIWHSDMVASWDIKAECPWFEIQYTDGQNDELQIWAKYHVTGDSAHEHSATLAEIIDIAKRWFDINRPGREIFITIKSDGFFVGNHPASNGVPVPWHTIKGRTHHTKPTVEEALALLKHSLDTHRLT